MLRCSLARRREELSFVGAQKNAGGEFRPVFELQGYYTLREVCKLTTLSATTIWRLRKAEEFPAPDRLTSGRIGWRKTVIHLWMANRLTQ